MTEPELVVVAGLTWLFMAGGIAWTIENCIGRPEDQHERQ